MNEYLVFCAQRIVYSLYSRAPDQIAYQCRNKNGIAIFQKCLVFLVFCFFQWILRYLFCLPRQKIAPKYNVKSNQRAIFQKCLVFLVFWVFSMNNKIFILFTQTENCAKVQR